MFKKMLSVLIVFVMALSLCFISTAAQGLYTKDFYLYVKVHKEIDNFEPITLRFNLFDEKGEWLNNQAVEVSKEGIIEICFPIGIYPVGSTFKLVATTGLEKYDYYGNIFSLNEECPIQTYAYRDEDGLLHICNEGFIETTPITATQKYQKEKHVNDLAVWSNTPYLIWVSKANFTVNVFYRENGKWNLVNEFPCSIGAPSTPTVTGQFVYHQYQPKWYYNGYYVGPVMRFYNGYALHSTLIYDDGTPKDSRIGKRISLGCVRMRPEEITYLSEIIPLDTKIYITEE